MRTPQTTATEALLKAIGFVAFISMVCTFAGLASFIAQVLKPDSISVPTKFEAADLVRPQDFIATLKQNNDPLAVYLRSRFSQTLQTHLNAYNTSIEPDPSLQKECLDEINSIIEGANIYDAQRFAGVELQERTFKLSQQNPIGRRAVMLNRWLIEDAYYDLLKRTADGLWGTIDKVNATFGGVYTFLFAALAYLSWAFLKVSDHFGSAEEHISKLVEGNSGQLVKFSAFGTISDLYPPLALSPALQKLFREHFGGVETADKPALHISASHGLYHVTIQSEALYYSLLCSLCRAFAEDIDRAWRSHVLLPNGVAILFVPEMIHILRGVPTQSRFYLFRNNFLDYDRSLMAFARARPDTLHLLSSFAKASRILFQDHGANYGFLDARGHRTIWQPRSEAFRIKFRSSCERLKLHLASNDAIVSAYVVRNSDSYAFEKGCIQIGDDASTSEFFRELDRAGPNDWDKAVGWSRFPVEVALISGEEMEASGKATVTIKAIDDYKQEGTGSGWLEAGDPRNLLWLKCVSASLRGATVQRIFLVDRELLQAGAAVSKPGEVIELFKTTALQHKFLTEDIDGRQRGAIKVVEKSDALFDHKAYSKWIGQRSYPDYWISIANDLGAERIEGGVALYPEARYLRAGDTEWIELFNYLWLEGKEFPQCFSAVVELVRGKEREIRDDMLERNELYQAGEEKKVFQHRLSIWLGDQLASI